MEMMPMGRRCLNGTLYTENAPYAIFLHEDNQKTGMQKEGPSNLMKLLIENIIKGSNDN